MEKGDKMEEDTYANMKYFWVLIFQNGKDINIQSVFQIISV